MEPDTLTEPPANRLTEARCAAFVDAIAASGLAASSQAVRYAAATSTALAGRQSAGTIMAVLGHADPATANDFYVMASQLDAQKKFAQRIRALNAT